MTDPAYSRTNQDRTVTPGRGALSAIPRIIGAYWPAECDTEHRRAVAGGWELDQPQDYCGRCGANAGPGSTGRRGCAFCIDQPLPWVGVTRLGMYREPIRHWIIRMKFQGGWWWGPWFGRRLADALPDHLPDAATGMTVVCPVPMHWTRRVWRGYNQAGLIARAIAKEKGWPVAELIRRRRRTKPQTSVTRSMRNQNLQRAFASKPIDLTGWTVCLVDDVKTTGATLRRCASTLHRQGAERVYVAVAAVADPRGKDFKTLPARGKKKRPTHAGPYDTDL